MRTSGGQEVRPERSARKCCVSNGLAQGEPSSHHRQVDARTTSLGMIPSSCGFRPFCPPAKSNNSVIACRATSSRCIPPSSAAAATARAEATIIAATTRIRSGTVTACSGKPATAPLAKVSISKSAARRQRRDAPVIAAARPGSRHFHPRH